MKIKLFTILLILVISCKNETITSSSIVESYKKKIIELNIHLVKTYEYEFRFGKPDENTKFLVESLEYDKNGNLIRQENYHRSEYLKDYDMIVTLSYDEKGNLTEKIEKDTKGLVKTITKFKNENELNTERIFYNSEGELESKVIYKYDKFGNCIELVSYDENGNIDYKIIYKYNKKNEEIESKTFDKNGSIERSTKLVELNDGWKKYQFFNEKNELFSEYLYIENENKLVVESIIKDIKSEREDKTINEFDENNLIVRITEYENHGEPKRLKVIERIKY